MKFVYDTGIRRKLFKNVRLLGTWDAQGRHSEQWSEHAMQEVVAADGANVFEAEVSLHPSEVGKTFSWRVLVDGPLGLDRDGIVTEAPGLGHRALERTFTLTDDATAEQRYYLTHVRRLGARKVAPQKAMSTAFALRFGHPMP